MCSIRVCIISPNTERKGDNSEGNVVVVVVVVIIVSLNQVCSVLFAIGGVTLISIFSEQDKSSMTKNTPLGYVVSTVVIPVL